MAKITFLGHGSLHITFGGKEIIVDPFITPNPKAGDIKVENLTADYILQTHGHGDHLADLETVLKQTGATLVSNYEIATEYGNKGYQAHPMNHGGKWKFDFGIVKYVNAVHSSSYPDGRYAGNSGGFVIWNDDECIYIAGDTALTWDMKLIPMTCPDLDLAILPIGDNFTMGYEDAVIASEFVNCTKVLGYHCDTFPYIEIDHDAAKNAFKDNGAELILLEIGGSLDI